MRVSPREHLVLTAMIVHRNGRTCASQSVAASFADREGLSSATVRNVMATLGEAGLLDQPHTSAGRVPTAAAFRYYVEQITQPGRLSGNPNPPHAMGQGASSLGRANAAIAPRAD